MSEAEIFSAGFANNSWISFILINFSTNGFPNMLESFGGARKVDTGEVLIF